MSIRTALDFYYGLIPGTYDKFGLIPWPEHLQPRPPNTPCPTATRTALINADGVVFLTLDNRDRTSIATTVERLIALLDEVDGDPDLEDEDEHGGDIVDEPHDEETDCNLAGAHSELEFDQGDYDGPGFIWGGNENDPAAPV